MLFPAAIERLYELKVGTTLVDERSRRERPHKPLLLLTAFDLIDDGLANPAHIPWCQTLRDRFTAGFLLVRKHDDQDDQDLPFRYLASNGFWQACEGDGQTPIRREIRVSDLGQVFARFTAGNDFSFIDAARLIPFSDSQNDHPANGLALCKNHHWAMDRNLIAPTPDHLWKASRLLDPRRSNGEKELIALSGQSLLLPQDEAFHPDATGLRWRCEQLIA